MSTDAAPWADAPEEEPAVEIVAGEGDVVAAFLEGSPADAYAAARHLERALTAHLVTKVEGMTSTNPRLRYLADAVDNLAALAGAANAVKAKALTITAETVEADLADQPRRRSVRVPGNDGRIIVAKFEPDRRTTFDTDAILGALKAALSLLNREEHANARGGALEAFDDGVATAFATLRDLARIEWRATALKAHAEGLEREDVSNRAAYDGALEILADTLTRAIHVEEVGEPKGKIERLEARP